MECHIESDFLLIWIDEQNGIVELVRLGSHSELSKVRGCDAGAVRSGVGRGFPLPPRSAHNPFRVIVGYNLSFAVSMRQR